MPDMEARDTVKRFDMKRPPMRSNMALLTLAAALCIPSVISHRTKITCSGTEDLKPPYLLLCNHNAFQDFKVAIKCTYPHRTNFVVAIDGFIGREELLRRLGCICKRKFTRDILLIRQLSQVIKNGNIAVLYPEARYSLCGTTAVLPSSLGKLCKILGVPVVTLICHGHHINSPFWNLKGKHVAPLEAEFSLLFTAEDLKKYDADLLNRKIVERFQYDDYRWQQENHIRVTYPKRAEGLEKVLYQCPHCLTEFRMRSEGTSLICGACGSTWNLTEEGYLKSERGGEESTATENKKTDYSYFEDRNERDFSHIPDWYEWERANVRKEVEAGTYSSGDLPARLMSLPNARKIIPLGEGILRHDMEGFHVRNAGAEGKERDAGSADIGNTERADIKNTGSENLDAKRRHAESENFGTNHFEMEIPAATQYSVHIEYEYLGKYGDCVDLNTIDDTWYISPHDCAFSVTKMALATEELYFYYQKQKGKPVNPGLA